MNSYVPERNDGGGGWSQLKFSLGSLYEQRQLVRNYWTKSNVALPLCKYNGCKFKFYRTAKVDYIVHYTNCLPMVDTEAQHTNAQPSAMLMYRHKILVPSMLREPHKRKPYITKFIKPPPQLKSQWYFQRDFCDVGLVMLTTTAIDLDRFFLNPESISNNISLTTLNTTLFQNRNFQQTDLGETYWGPKPQTWLFGLQQQYYEQAKLKDVIPLFQTQRYQEGSTLQTIFSTETPTTYIPHNKQLLWFGNVFHSFYINGESHVVIYSGTKTPNELFKDYEKQKDTLIKTIGFALLTQPLKITVRYNPNKDTGDGNEIYFKKNTRNESGWDAPPQPNLSLTGYPAWLSLWGYADWHEKLHQIQQIDLNYMLVIKSTFFSEKLPAYVFFDDSFWEGHSPYQKEGEPLPADKAFWLPRHKYQKISVDNICKTGPGTVKTTTQSIEAHCFYCFYFKWGGCPNDLENIYDPCEQPKYSIPSTVLQTTEIQNPASDPTKELYPFDFRRQLITKKAADRIKKDSDVETTLFTDSKFNADIEEETSEEEGEVCPPKETETPHLLDQCLLEQRLLRKRIFKLIKKTPHIRLKNAPLL